MATKTIPKTSDREAQKNDLLVRVKKLLDILEREAGSATKSPKEPRPARVYQDTFGLGRADRGERYGLAFPLARVTGRV